MKKQLLTTTAMLAMVGGAASAQEWSMDVGGYYQSHAAFSSLGGTATNNEKATGVDREGFDMFTDAEIFFSPSITLDNGITFGAQVQLEAEPSAGSQIDETYITISSDTLGRVILGNENSASYLMWGATPGVGSLGINSGTISQYIPLVGAGPNTLTDLAGDAQKISYITPSFNGLTLGLSYAPSSASSGSGDNPGAFDRNGAGLVKDIFSVAANYEQTFGGGSFYLGLKYQQAERNASTFGGLDGGDPSNYGVAAAYSTAGFTFGAEYFESDADSRTVAGVGNDTGDTTAYSLGVTYDLAGPWTIGFDYINDQQDTSNTTKIEEEAYRIGAARDLGPGVTVDVFAISYDGKDTATPANNRDGTIIGSALTLSF